MKPLFKPLFAVILSIFFTLGAYSVRAQSIDNSRGSGTTRSVEGIVTDSGGRPVAEAQVLLKDMKSLSVRSFITQVEGMYHFYGLSSDVDYEVHALREDAASANKSISVFDSHKVITLNLKLK